jgi:hypothetical protein
MIYKINNGTQRYDMGWCFCVSYEDGTQRYGLVLL